MIANVFLGAWLSTLLISSQFHRVCEIGSISSHAIRAIVLMWICDMPLTNRHGVFDSYLGSCNVSIECESYRQVQNLNSYPVNSKEVDQKSTMSSIPLTHFNVCGRACKGSDGIADGGSSACASRSLHDNAGEGQSYITTDSENKRKLHQTNIYALQPAVVRV